MAAAYAEPSDPAARFPDNAPRNYLVRKIRRRGKEIRAHVPRTLDDALETAFSCTAAFTVTATSFLHPMITRVG